MRHLALLAGLLLIVPAAAQRGRPRRGQSGPLRVAVVTDGPIDGPMKRMLERMASEAKQLLESGRGVVLAAEKQRDCGWSVARVKETNDAMLADAEVDLVVSFGTLGMLDMVARSALPKPVLVPLAFDPRFMGLPVEGDRSGKKNFSYLVYTGTFFEDIKAFRELVGVSTQHVIVDRLILEAMPRVAELAADVKQNLGITLVPVAAEPTADRTLAALPAGATAVVIAPLPRMPMAEKEKLFAGLARRKVRTFSTTGRAEVKLGAMLTQTRNVDLLRVSRRMALNIERVAGGADPKGFSIQLRRQTRLIINMATARAVGWSPSWEVLAQAELESAQGLAPGGRKLSLAQAMREFRAESNLFGD